MAAIESDLRAQGGQVVEPHERILGKALCKIVCQVFDLCLLVERFVGQNQSPSRTELHVAASPTGKRGMGMIARFRSETKHSFPLGGIGLVESRSLLLIRALR